MSQQSAPTPPIAASRLQAAAAGKAATSDTPSRRQGERRMNVTQTPAASSSSENDRKPKAARESDVANGLLNLERQARVALTEAELGYLMVNGSRVAVQYRQAILILRAGQKKHRVVAVSSLSAIDRNSTFIRWVERVAQEKLQGENLSKVISFDVRREALANDLDASNYPFGQIALLPLQLRDGTVFAHLMFTRESEWDERSLVAAARLCETFSHSWEALTGAKRTKRRLRSKTLWWLAGAAVVVIGSFFPVPLSVLAPAEVTPSSPFVVAAPIDGTIDSIAVDPNTPVEEGDLLFRYNDTDLSNRLKLAGQAVGVAEARYQQNVRTSFSDPKAKRELAIAQSELRLKAGEYDYARELMDKTLVTAGKSGIVIFADKDTWTGRPVSTGERIMRIADPSKVEMTINLPVSDAIVLQENADVQLYLDSDPLKAISGKLESASFHAKPDSAGVLSYRVRAQFMVEEGEATPRIGLRGTAKVYGENVSLAYYLFRKPLSVVRQWTGY